MSRVKGGGWWLLLGLLAMPAQAATVRYVHTDALGSVVAKTDAAGTVVERREYEPYGAQLTPAVADGPGYTGHVQDAATGLVYMQARYYDDDLGRFLSVDPVTADANTGARFNRYQYAANNPYRFVDPDGRKEDERQKPVCQSGSLCNTSPGFRNSAVSGMVDRTPAKSEPSRGNVGAFLGGVVAGAESYVDGAAHAPVHVAERYGLLGEDKRSIALEGESVVIDAAILLSRDIDGALKSAIDVYKAAPADIKSELIGRVVGRLGFSTLVSVKYTPFIGMPVTGMSAVGTALEAGEQHGDEFRIVESIIYGQVIAP